MHESSLLNVPNITPKIIKRLSHYNVNYLCQLVNHSGLLKELMQEADLSEEEIAEAIA
jgi:hypothetical protein